MKCINAAWEERNLGVKTIEISIEKGDIALTGDEICSKIEDFRRNFQAKYVVVKVDTKYPFVSQWLQNAGFTFIESQIGLKLDRDSALEKYNEYKSMFDGVGYKRVDKSELRYILDEIRKGIFSTDRIALDPYFGVEVANRRYALWMEDEVGKGAEIFISCYNNQPIGFFSARNIGKGQIKGLLGGLFVDDDSKHYGGLYLFSTLKSFIDGGGKIDKTVVSSNNVPILQLHLMFGRKITNITNVFIKHFE